MNRFRPALVGVCLLVATEIGSAQLPFLVAPTGTLRIELRGSFDPANREFADGQARDLAEPLRATPLGVGNSPLIADMASRLEGVIGRQVNDGSLGSLGAELEFQRGTGVIGLAVGVTRRITIGVDLPIVSVRTQRQLTPDAEGATVGLNPALFGSSSTTAYLSQLDQALSELGSRLSAGSFDDDPVLKTDAEALLASGPDFRDRLAALLTETGTATPVLPLSTSDDGEALLERTNSFRDQFGERFGVTGFSAGIGLPTTAITDNDLAALLVSPLGFDLAPSTDVPLVGLGDARVGATVAIFSSGDVASGSSLGIWGHAGLRLPSGTPARPEYLRDQGTGEGGYAIDLGGTIDASRGALGLRASATFVRRFVSERSARVGLRDEFLLPVNRTTTLSRTPGNVLRVDLQPYLRIADHFALTGRIGFRREGAASWQASAATRPIAGGDIATMGRGTGGSAITAGIGFSYAHDGISKTGEQKMPVEAGFGISRVVSSGSGLVPARLATGIWFRVYKRIFGQ